MLLVEFIIISILVDSQISQIDLVSKILSALSVLEIKWSDIETNRHYNYNWRPSNSIWGKLSKTILYSNRASHRAKIMNVQNPIHYSSIENEPIYICGRNHKEYNTESIKSFEIFLNRHERESYIMHWKHI